MNTKASLPIIALQLTVLILCVSAAALTDAAEQELFFKGKSVRFIVATSAGGGFDTYTRTIARHIGRHIPGNPSTLVENMPGAGQLIGTKYMYNQAKPDGLTIGNFHGGGRILQQMLEVIRWDTTCAISSGSVFQCPTLRFAS